MEYTLLSALKTRGGQRFYYLSKSTYTPFQILLNKVKIAEIKVLKYFVRKLYSK